MASYRTIPIRRAAAAALAGAMILSVVPAATTTAGVTDAPKLVRQTEWKVLGAMNRARARHGLQPLRMATQVRIVARDRSRDMRNRGYFDHQAPDGSNASTLLNRRGVRYFLWSENIAWTANLGIADAADYIANAWMGSPGHRRTLLSRDFNYVGVGLARSGRQTWYTTVFVRQLDHTAPDAGMVASGRGLSVASAANGSRQVTVRWWGRDKLLQVNTAGIKAFRVQYKQDGGRWQTLRWRTLERSLTKTLPKGEHRFRVRATDRRGNVGAWKRSLTVTVH